MLFISNLCTFNSYAADSLTYLDQDELDHDARVQSGMTVDARTLVVQMRSDPDLSWSDRESWSFLSLNFPWLLR